MSHGKDCCLDVSILLWQERFASYPMDDVHLLVAVRYVELNPVKARLVNKPDQWKFSSAKAHIYQEEDILVKPSQLNDMVSDWEEFLGLEPPNEGIKTLQRHERTGRPLENESFIISLEKSIGRHLKPKKPGRKLKQEIN